jgi:hypothetical protein
MQQFVDARIILAGVIGPALDGYATDEALNADAAFAYHRDQANALAGLDVDLPMRQLFQRFRNCLALPAPWRKLAGNMPWHRCCTRTARC